MSRNWGQILRVGAMALGVSAVVGGLGWLLFGSDELRYRRFVVEGHARATATQIQHLADLPLGAPLLLLDIDAAAAGIAAHPWVDSVQVRRVFPDTVVVQVEERQVRALLLLDNLYLVDSHGTPFKRADATDLDHPLITGLTPALAEKEPELGRRVVRDALAILDGIQGKGGLQESDVSEVRFHPLAGYTVALRNGGEVALGFHAQQQLPRLEVLAREGVDLHTPHRIDLGMEQLAVVTPLK